MEFGYDEAYARMALEKSGDEIDRALAWIEGNP
eukprot:SAG11_NODE_25379_length_359_cov_1.365385_2_plen_32_part_01